MFNLWFAVDKLIHPQAIRVSIADFSLVLLLLPSLKVIHTNSCGMLCVVSFLDSQLPFIVFSAILLVNCSKTVKCVSGFFCENECVYCATFPA